MLVTYAKYVWLRSGFPILWYAITSLTSGTRESCSRYAINFRLLRHLRRHLTLLMLYLGTVYTVRKIVSVQAYPKFALTNSQLVHW